MSDIPVILLNFIVTATFLVVFFTIAFIVEEVVLWLKKN